MGFLNGPPYPQQQQTISNKTLTYTIGQFNTAHTHLKHIKKKKVPKTNEVGHLKKEAKQNHKMEKKLLE